MVSVWRVEGLSVVYVVGEVDEESGQCLVEGLNAV